MQKFEQVLSRVTSAACLGLLVVGLGAPASAQDRSQDRPRPAAKTGKQDAGRTQQGKGQHDGAKKHDGAQERDRARKQDGDHKQDRPAGADRDAKRDGPKHDVPSDQRGERSREQNRDQVTDKPAGANRQGNIDVERQRKLHGLERSHRMRVARMERLREIYGAEGDTDKVAELDRMLERQRKLYEGQMARHEKELGREGFQRATRDIPKHDGPQARQGNRARDGQRDQARDKVTDKQTDKVTDKPSDRPTDKPPESVGKEEPKQ